MTPPSPDFEALFEASPFPVVVMAADAPYYTIMAVNDLYLNTMNLTRALLLGRGGFEVFPDDGVGPGREEIGRLFDEVVRTGELQQQKAVRYSVTDKDGVSRVLYWDVRCTPLKSRTGEAPVTHVILSVSNVTEQVENEARAREKESLLLQASSEQQRATQLAESLQQIIDTVQAGIFIFTPVYDESNREIIDFRFRIVNQALASYVGQNAESVTGTLGSIYFPDYKTNGLFARYRNTAVSGETERFEFHYEGGGIDVWLDIMSTRIGDEVLVTFTDHTELWRMQERSEKIVAELKRSNSNLEEFAYVASHDLQEPLRKIQAFGDMLQKRFATNLGSEGTALVTRMQGAAIRMRTLIDDLLTYSRLSVRPDRMQTIDTGAVLQEVLTDLETAFREKAGHVQWHGLDLVHGDPLQLRQLFQNLLSNALKFAKPDVPPQIVIEGSRERGLTVGFDAGSPESRKMYLRIDVQDNGIGFEPEYAERIFQIFQRLHGRSEVPGTGVGLSIVHKVVENHGGRIVAASVPGHGATFTVWLPLAEAGS
jgi:signal transduction histidine kinase